MNKSENARAKKKKKSAAWLWKMLRLGATRLGGAAEERTGAVLIVIDYQTRACQMAQLIIAMKSW